MANTTSEEQIRLIVAENTRLRAQLAPVPEFVTVTVDHTDTYVIAVVALAALAFGLIAAVWIFRPDKDNAALTTGIIAVLVTLVSPLLAASIREVKQALNGRLSQLIIASRAEGQLAEQTSAAEKKGGA